MPKTAPAIKRNEMPPSMGKPGGPGPSKLFLLFGGGGGSLFSAKTEMLDNIKNTQQKYVKIFLRISFSVIHQ